MCQHSGNFVICLEEKLLFQNCAAPLKGVYHYGASPNGEVFCLRKCEAIRYSKKHDCLILVILGSCDGRDKKLANFATLSIQTIVFGCSYHMGILK